MSRAFGSQRPSKAHDRAAAVQLACNAREMPSTELLMQRYRLTRQEAQEIIYSARRARGELA
jgi:hypothetical protein